MSKLSKPLSFSRLFENAIRNLLFWLGLIIFSSPFLYQMVLPAHAVMEVDITRGKVRALPIALPYFAGRTPELEQTGRLITRIVATNLANSGLFKPLNPASYIQQNVSMNTQPRFSDWKVIRAQALVVGSIDHDARGNIRAGFRLWDVFAGRQLEGQQFTSPEGSIRRIAHMIADVVYERLTGEKGYFDSRIVFIDETGDKRRRIKRLAIMDQDGKNFRALTNGKDLVLTPRFNPARQQIAYMSYAGGEPRVVLMNLKTGQRKSLGAFPGMTYAPRFSPDGSQIVMSLQTPAGANIFTMDLASGRKRQLTDDRGINTSPSFSPDGRQIVFESDRSGTQQLYVMSANGTEPRRISRQDGRYSTPVWSPRGDMIAFTKQYRGRFLIGVMKPDGSGERIITEGWHNEGPTWSPNGRVIMFFREGRGTNSGSHLYSVDLTGYNEKRIKTPSFASDPAWSPLLK